MTDIVERLRNTHRGEWLEVRPAMLNEAADEIERLREMNGAGLAILSQITKKPRDENDNLQKLINLAAGMLRDEREDDRD